MKKYIKIWACFLGLIAGILNGLLGAGGGMLIVPILASLGLSTKKAHATSPSIILPICLVSAINYLINGKVQINQALPYMISGIIGVVVGAFILDKISSVWLRRLFGVFILWAAVRMLF